MEPFPDRHFKTWTIDEVRAATDMPGSKQRTCRSYAWILAVEWVCG